MAEIKCFEILYLKKVTGYVIIEIHNQLPFSKERLS